MTQPIDELLRGPDKLENIYIHRKNKDYVTAIITRNGDLNNFRYEFLISDTGFRGTPINTGIFSDNVLSNSIGNIYAVATNLSKYLSKNGYKGVTKITQTKNGTKLS